MVLQGAKTREGRERVRRREAVRWDEGLRADAEPSLKIVGVIYVIRFALTCTPRGTNYSVVSRVINDDQYSGFSASRVDSHEPNGTIRHL